MRVAVIGSGPAGIASVKALIRRGLKPTLIDVGERLSADRQAVVDRMAAQSPSAWDEGDRDFITQNPTILGGGVPKKMVFGSDFHFARDRRFFRSNGSSTLPTSTFASGGYTIAWGAAVMPTHDDDLADWPIRHADLEPSYRRVLAELPLTGAHDALEASFPVFKPDIGAFELAGNARGLLADLSKVVRPEGPEAVLAGQARLAIDGAACRRCGLCLSGCVYGAIYSLADQPAGLARSGLLDHRSGVFVESLDRRDNAVRVVTRYTDTGIRNDETFDYVFLAAGALQSTRIILSSLNLFDTPVTVKDSQKFILPFLRLKGASHPWPHTTALASLFLDFKVPDVSQHWVHAQISMANDYVLRRLRVPPWRDGDVRRRLAAPLINRLMVAWCGLHSDHSSGLRLSVERSSDGVASATLASAINPAARDAVERAVARLSRVLRRSGSIAVRRALMVGAPGSGNHFGGTLPMRARRSSRLDTDTLGRLDGLERCFVVDGSVLPSIPATTLTLSLMANADRIATAADLV